MRQVQDRYLATEAQIGREIVRFWDAARAEEGEAKPYDEAFFDDLDRQIAATHLRLNGNRGVESTVEEAIRLAETELHAQSYGTNPTDDQRELLSLVEACGYDQKWHDLQHLEQQEERARNSQRDVETKLADALKALESLRRDAEGQTLRRAQVVATTLAYARMRSAIKNDKFDVVLVDEVGMAAIGEVLGALAFPFQRLGIQSPADAMGNPSCVTLVHQFRFGARLRELANDLIYDVLEDGDSLPETPPNPQTDIVVLDTADLGGHEEIVRPQGKSAGWTSGGMLLSRALAATHIARGESVGVLTPYRYQVDATRASLLDASDLEAVPVGTVHSFQGTEYDVAVFDLVEDGNGWMANTSRNPSDSWGHEGLRLAAVAATRARRRLYLLLNLETTRPPLPSETLMHVVHDGVASGRFEIWSAAELLGLTPQRANVETGVFGAVQRELSKTVGVEAVYDERTFHSTGPRRPNCPSRPRTPKGRHHRWPDDPDGQSQPELRDRPNPGSDGPVSGPSLCRAHPEGSRRREAGDASSLHAMWRQKVSVEKHQQEVG